MGEVNQFTAGHLLPTQVTLVKVESVLAHTGECEELGGGGGLALALEPRLLTFLRLPVEGPSEPLWVLKTVGAIWSRGCISL